MESMKIGADMGHIYLTGMMGSGKSAVGNELAKKLHMPFADLDKLIEKEQGRTINEIFLQDGEPFFRNVETKILRTEAYGEEAKIISCGGGIIILDENIRIMHETGTVVLIYRDIETIIKTVNTKKRPLLKDGGENVRKIFEERAERYEKTCNVKIENNGTIQQATEQIISRLELR